MGCKRCAKAEAWPTPRSSNSCEEHEHDSLDDTAPAVDETAGRDVMNANEARARATQERRIEGVDSDAVTKRRSAAVVTPSVDTASIDAALVRSGDIAFFKRRSP